MSKQKAKGTAFETLCLKEIQRFHPHARRSALAGSADVGDMYLPGEGRFVLEMKHVARFNLAGWHGEAQTEAANAGVPIGVVVHKRTGKGSGADQWVTLTLNHFLSLVYPEGPVT